MIIIYTKRVCVSSILDWSAEDLSFTGLVALWGFVRPVPHVWMGPVPVVLMLHCYEYAVKQDQLLIRLKRESRPQHKSVRMSSVDRRGGTWPPPEMEEVALPDESKLGDATAEADLSAELIDCTDQQATFAISLAAVETCRELGLGKLNFVHFLKEVLPEAFHKPMLRLTMA